MCTYTDLLKGQDWKTKRNIILNRDKNLCLICSNHNYLGQLSIGYIKRHDNGDLLLGWNLSGLRNSTIVDLDNDYRWHMLYIKDRENINFDNLKNYVVYFEITETYRSIIAICEVDKAYDQFHAYLSIESNPYRRREFFKNAKYVQLKGLHVHHTYYQAGKLPWEYPDESLKTVCWKCHEQIHAEQKIPCLDANYNLIMDLTPCGRCLGAGYLFDFDHLEDVICSECWGKRYNELVN